MIGLLILVIELAVIVAIIAGLWKVFVKAGKPGWAAIVPIYNIIVLLEIADKPLWWIILFFIPFVNVIMAILVGIAVAKNFGKSDAFGVGLGLLGFIFYPILGLATPNTRARNSPPDVWFSAAVRFKSAAAFHFELLPRAIFSTLPA